MEFDLEVHVSLLSALKAKRYEGCADHHELLNEHVVRAFCSSYPSIVA